METSRMNCPKCHVCNTKVLESRPSAYGTRRRRECLRGHRFTTYEMIGDQDDARDRAIVAIGPELDALQDAIDRLRHKRVGGSNVVTWG